MSEKQRTLTAVKAGTAKITTTTQDGKKATITITITK